MLYLAYKTWRSSIVDAAENTACTFWDGFLVQFTNAKMILFELTAYSSFVLPYSDRLIDLLFVCALLLIAGPIANLVWLLVGSSIRPFIVKYQRIIGAVLALALVACAVLVVSSSNPSSDIESIKDLSERVYDVAKVQMSSIDARLEEGCFPKTYEAGNAVDSDVNWWCSGFYPGTMWLLYEQTGDPRMKELAEKHTLRMASLLDMETDHDIGFQIGCSYGNAYRITGESRWLPAMEQGARKLAGRFSSVTGTTKSWNFSRGWDWPVIIDNMMNLELLTASARLFGADSLAQIAMIHANTTIANHFREDYSTYHLVDYDSTDGSVLGRQTVQGYADDSAWARGQAWALYGFTMMARETGDARYLRQAEGIASYVIARLPEDGIPYWDFDDPSVPEALRDASAGAIIASALAELSGLTADANLSNAFRAMAEKQVRTLASPEYLAEPGTNGGFILKHGVGNIPGGTEIDVPLTYADYYFIEALGRLK